MNLPEVNRIVTDFARWYNSCREIRTGSCISMKKTGYLRVLSAVVFLVMMFSSSAFAWKGEQTAVDSGVLRMEEVSGYYGLDPSGLELKIHESVSINGEKPTVQSLMETYGSSFELISLSPDGSSAIGYVENQLIGIRGNCLIPVFVWNDDRGVQDEYGYMQFYQKTQAKKWFDRSGVAWSPDGRYAVMINGWNALSTAKAAYAQLYIMDLEKAEVYLAAAWGNKIKDMGFALYPSFDRTGRYIYFSMYGGDHPYACAFMRYDMETGQCETLSESSSWFANYPGLWETNSQEWVCMQNGNGGETMVAHYLPAESGWQCRLSMITVPKSFFTGRTLLYMRECNQAAIISGGQTRDGSVRFTLIKPDEGEFVTVENGLQAQEISPQYYSFIRRPGSDEISMVTYATEEEYQQALQPQGSESTETASVFVITAADVSPDGKSILMSIAEGEESHLILMDGATSFFRIIDVPASLGEQPRFYGSPLSGYAPGLDWCCGDYVLAETKEGVRLFQLIGLAGEELPLWSESESVQKDTGESGTTHQKAESWTCPNCGQEGNESAFCPECGTQKPGETNTWTCPNCGHEGNERSFCPKCGTPRP